MEKIFQTANLGIFYRTKLFEAAGITETPKTWEELRQVAKKLTIDRNGDKRPEQYGILLPLGKGEWTVFSWFPFLLSAGGDILTDNNQPNFTNSGAIQALQFWQDLMNGQWERIFYQSISNLCKVKNTKNISNQDPG